MANWTIESIKSNCRINDKGCWIWKGSLNQDGYARITIDGERWLAHRYILSLSKGIKLNPNDIICHKCNDRACNNPEHIYLGSRTENTNDSIKAKTHVSGFAVHQSTKTHCIHGHKYTPENTYYRGKYRRCRECTLKNNRIYAEGY